MKGKSFYTPCLNGRPTVCLQQCWSVTFILRNKYLCPRSHSGLLTRVHEFQGSFALSCTSDSHRWLFSEAGTVAHYTACPYLYLYTNGNAHTLYLSSSTSILVWTIMAFRVCLVTVCDQRFCNLAGISVCLFFMCAKAHMVNVLKINLTVYLHQFRAVWKPKMNILNFSCKHVTSPKSDSLIDWYRKLYFFTF